VVHSLQTEFTGKIRFLIVDITSREGRAFAQIHNVRNITLLFFSPDGTRLATLTGLQEPDYLRRAFKRAFKL